MRTLPLSAVIVLIGAQWNLSADTYPRQPAIDAIHYRVALTVAPDSPRIQAESVGDIPVARARA
jgi:hypothetical protein